MNTAQTIKTLKFCRDIPKEIEFKNHIGRAAENLRLLKDEIESELDILPYREKRILYMFYIEGKRWNAVSREMNYCPTHCKNIRRIALRRLSFLFGANSIICEFIGENVKVPPLK